MISRRVDLRSHRESSTIPPRPLDTSRKADELQFQIVREMPFEKRWRILFDFIESGMRTLDDGIRNRHPEYSNEEVRLASIRARIGDELFVKAYPKERLPAL